MIATLQEAVGSQAWDWLAALAHELNIAVEIVDSQGAPCLPADTPQGTRVRAARLTEAPVMAEAKTLSAKVLRSGRHEQASMDTLDLCAFRVQASQAVAGVLVLARERGRTTRRTADAAPALESLGKWLTPAVEAQLRRAPNDEAEAFDRVASLHNLLHEAVDRGGEREVVTAFAEALFAWDGVEVSGYVEDIDGAFVLAVATPGSARGRASVARPTGAARFPASLTRVSPAELERFGFAADRHALAAELAGGTLDPWLLIVAQGFGALDQQRLALYIELLREGLSRAAIINETRASWAIMQQLLGAADGVKPAIEAALVELTAAIPGSTPALAVTASSGVSVFSVGDADKIAAGAEGGAGRRLVCSQRLLDQYTMVLALRRPAGQAFTRREQHIVERAAEIFAAWLPGMLRQTARPRDRRAEHREFEQVLDRAATQTTIEGMDVSLLVISAPEAVLHPGLLHKWVAEIRGQLRGSDLAGALSDREIGVLLSGTSAEFVPVVCERFRQALVEAGGPEATIGSATRAPGQDGVDSLVAAARQRATTRPDTGRAS